MRSIAPSLHCLVGNMVIVSDVAGQFGVGNHALCWVNCERLLQKLMPAIDVAVKRRRKSTATSKGIVVRQMMRARGAFPH